MNLELGEIRDLTGAEKRSVPLPPSNCCCVCVPYKYVVTKPFRVTMSDEKQVVVPVGFLSDGATGAPDTGVSWIFHDYLYAYQKWLNRKPCSRKEADQLMSMILKQEKRKCYRFIFNLCSSMNCCGVFSRAFRNRPKKEPKLAQELFASSTDFNNSSQA